MELIGVVITAIASLIGATIPSIFSVIREKKKYNLEKYATPKIISEYNDVLKYKYYYDFSGFKKEIETLILFTMIIEEHIKLVNKEKLLNKENILNLKKYYVYYIFCISILKVRPNEYKKRVLDLWQLDSKKLLSMVKKISKNFKKENWNEIIEIVYKSKKEDYNN